MTIYIHQLPDWPTFKWNNKKLTEKLATIRHRQGKLLGRIESFGIKLRDEALLQTLTEEVVKSSEIEGEILNREQVRSSLAKRLGINIGGLLPADRHVDGIVQMILDATQNYNKPFTKDRLFGWHAALFPTGYSGLLKITVGGWRSSEAGPMQVVSGRTGKEHVHYEAPEAALVEKEMQTFLTWFNRDDSGTDLVLKAAIGHLWFETIHPFEDGNGRIGRAIADMILARSEESAQRFYSISAQIKAEQNQYYDYLENTQKGDLDITDYLVWFLDCLGHAFDRAQIILADVLRKAKFWEIHAENSFNERQRLMIHTLLSGIEGNLTSSKWAKMTKTSQDTAGRDIDGLLRTNILVKEPERGRSTNYLLVVTASDVLRVIAKYVEAFSSTFATGKATSPSNEENALRQKILNLYAEQINMLASSDHKIKYQDFEPILAGLHANGFYPEQDLLSTLAFTTRDAA